MSVSPEIVDISLRAVRELVTIGIAIANARESEAPPELHVNTGDLTIAGERRRALEKLEHFEDKSKKPEATAMIRALATDLRLEAAAIGTHSEAERMRLFLTTITRSTRAIEALRATSANTSTGAEDE